MPQSTVQSRAPAPAPTTNRSWAFKLSVVLGIACLIYSWWTEGLSSKAMQKLNTKKQPRVVYDLTFNPELPEDTRNRTQIGGEKAALFMLVRNEELRGTLETMREIEDRFNKRYRYPWVFVNDKPFTEEFKEMTRGMASGEVEHGFVEPEVWSIPPHIDQEHMHKCMAEMVEKDVIYGDSESYRNMCRYYSGNFFEHELMLKYDWYWRLEPGVHYFCDQLYDPFQFMKNNNKTYGFTIAIMEYPDTIPTLWDVTKQFLDMHPEYIAQDSALDFVLDNDALRPDDFVIEKDYDYNLCHFWSNFEIVNLNFFRSKPYREYFQHLDAAGGFYYERWGDAPVHTLGAVAFLNKSQIHHFSDIGYQHIPYFRCPKDFASHASGRCLCPQEGGLDVDFEPFSCLPKWWKHAGRYFMFTEEKQANQL